MTMTDTPRTDAIVRPFIGNERVSPVEANALLDHARQLERELRREYARGKIDGYREGIKAFQDNARRLRDLDNKLETFHEDVRTLSADIEKWVQSGSETVIQSEERT